jgi:hypothetical protein
VEKGPEGPGNPLLPSRRGHDVVLAVVYGQRHRRHGSDANDRMPVVVCCEHASHLSLRTLERQSLCESHRQRRWLTHWSYLLWLANAILRFRCTTLPW